jgi:hypothetical protein
MVPSSRKRFRSRRLTPSVGGVARASLRGLVATSAVVLTPAEAAADRAGGASEPIRITYTAGASCPTRDDFIANVRRYTTRWRLAEDGSERSFRLLLAPSSKGTAGRLELEGEPSARQIAGPDCESVARALAIALAVMIDPDADLSGNATEPPPTEAEPAPPPPVPGAPTPLPVPAPQTRAPETARPRKTPVAAVAPASRAHVNLEAGAAITTAVIDGILPVAGITVELVSPALHHQRWLRPSIALGARQSLPGDVEASGLASEFLWSAGALRLCPVRWTAIDERLELAPCFETNAGVLRATATGGRAAPSATRPWLDLGGAARATFHMTPSWFAGATVAVVAPFTRYRFELPNQTSVSQAPATGLTASASVGLRF